MSGLKLNGRGFDRVNRHRAIRRSRFTARAGQTRSPTGRKEGFRTGPLMYTGRGLQEHKKPGLGMGLPARKRRKSMQRWLVGLLVLMITPALAQQAVPEIPFESVPDPIKLPPDLYLGEVTGVAVNSKGHVFVFSRGNTTGPAYGASAAQLLEFGPDGTFIREIGKHLY